MSYEPPRRDVNVLPLHLLDADATRPSGFVSGPKSLKGKATQNSVSLHLPLKEWSIGAAISPQEVTPAPLVDLVVESGRLKVKDANGLTQFELQLIEGSVKSVKYVDITVGLLPAWQGRTLNSPSESCDLRAAHPDSTDCTCHCTKSRYVQVQTRYFFVFLFRARFHLILIPTCLGSDDILGGFLTFKFHTSASDWDDNVYLGIVRKLGEVMKKGKSILEYAPSLQLLPMLTS